MNFRPNRRKALNEKLTGWSAGTNHLRPRGSDIGSYIEMISLKSRSRGSVIKMNEGSVNNAESCFTPLRVKYSTKANRKSYVKPKDMPSFIIHETDLDLN
jgi:hypothetical protein